jgi:methylated-DNA-[protein]-cysteine S-methyltransferase
MFEPVVPTTARTLLVLDSQSGDYIGGGRRAFAIAVAPPGTVWQRRVWDELARIPFGETITYAELARRAGNPTAIRAAGAANGQNPISIVIPCHRVVGSDGRLTGYSGGLDAKRWLLDHEGVA